MPKKKSISPAPFVHLASWQYIIDKVRKINQVYWAKTRIFLSKTPPTLIAVL